MKYYVDSSDNPANLRGNLSSVMRLTNICTLFLWIFNMIVCPSVQDESLTVVRKTPLYLLGLHPMTGAWPGGNTIQVAVEMALDHINANQSILPDYELIQIIADTGVFVETGIGEGNGMSWAVIANEPALCYETLNLVGSDEYATTTNSFKNIEQCSVGQGIDSMYRELYNFTKIKVMIIGPACSVAAEAVAEAAHRWNLMQISYSAASPALSDRDLYPKFFRLCLSENIVNYGRIAILEHFRWKKVATIQQNADLFTLALADFRKRADQKGIDIITSETFTDDPTYQLRYIKNIGARIIFANAYRPECQLIYCTAYRLGMYGPKYVWIMPAWFEKNWWTLNDDESKHNCTAEQMNAVAKGSISIYYAILLHNSASATSSISGMTAEDYVREFRIRSGNDSNVETLFAFGEAAYGYDSVWTAAVVLDEADRRLHAMDPSKSILDFRYDNNVIGEMLFEIMTNTSFPGLTGPVVFSDSGDRKGLIRIMQTQNNTDVRIAVYNVAAEPGKELKFENDTSVFWEGGKVPVDSSVEKQEIQIIHPAVFIIMAVFSIFGIWLAVFFLIFNILYRNRRIIKMSSPRLNNVILVGGLITYLSVIFLGIDVGFVSDEVLPLACRAYTWCFYVSFCMTFGAMFSKTWRVHRIFTTKSVMPRRIRDPQLFAWVGALVLFVVLILSAWEVFDPLVLIRKDGSPSADPYNDDIIIIPVFVICTSQWEPYWIGALYVIEGLLLVFGAFLSWETRKVHMPVLNDSKQIGTSIYIVVTTNFAAVPVSIAVPNPSARYALLSALIITSVTVPLCLVFLPKVKMRNDVYPRGLTSTHSTHHSTQNNYNTPTPTPIVSQDQVRLRIDDTSDGSKTSRHVTEDKGSNTLLSFVLGDNRTILRQRRRRKLQNKESPW